MATNKYVSSLAGGGGDGSIGTPWTLAEAIAGASAGDIVNIKADGTYTFNASQTIGRTGQTDNPIVWRGYLTNIGDGGVPVLYVNKNDADYGFVTTGAFNEYESLHFKSNCLWSTVRPTTSNNQIFRYCTFFNEYAISDNDKRRGCLNPSIGVHCYNCTFVHSVDDEDSKEIAAIRVQDGSETLLIGCILSSSSTALHIVNNSTVMVSNCLFIGNGNNCGIYAQTAAAEKCINLIQNSIIDGFINGIYVDVGSGDSREIISIVNCILSNNSSYGLINGDSVAYPQHVISIYNAFYNNGTDLSIGTQTAIGTILVTEDPYVDRGSLNYSLNSSESGGALCRTKGFPQYIGNNSYPDVGCSFNNVNEVPSEDDVRDGVTYGLYTGNMTLPSEFLVYTGVQYGTGGIEFTGTLDEPSENDVRDGVTYGSTAFTGNLEIPDEYDVRKNTTYGTLGTEFTGTLVSPNENDVRDHTRYGGDSTEYAGNLVLPSVEDVLSGVQYGSDGTQFTGILSGGSFTSNDRSTLNETYSVTGDIITNVDEIFSQTENIINNLNEVIKQTKNIRYDIFTA